MPIRIRSLILPAVASLVLVACGGSVERVPDATSNANGADPGVSGGSRSGSSSGGGGAGGNCTMAPACNEGDTSFTSQDKACIEITGLSCYARSACGTTIWCQRFDDSCDGYPVCPPGYAQVKACVPDSDCKTYSACGVTVICEKAPPPCLGPQPICDPGDKQVPTQSDCLQDDAKCYSRSNGCGYTIWCTGPA